MVIRMGSPVSALRGYLEMGLRGSGGGAVRMEIKRGHMLRVGPRVTLHHVL
jgi:hypothetical protein